MFKKFTEAGTYNIMAQAGIKVNHLEPNIYNNDTMLNVLFDGKIEVGKKITKIPVNMKERGTIY